MSWVAVLVGGGLGSLARHWVNVEVGRRLAPSFPVATLGVNVLGCILIGALAGAVTGERLHVPPAMRTFAVTGLLGGFTTFSSFGLETLTLAHGANPSAALWNVVGHLALGLGGVWLGFTLTS